MSAEGVPERDDLIGRVLGGFTVRERLGSGGFGTVYVADQEGLGREAVVKVLNDNVRRDESSDQRFLREAKLAATLDHPFAAHIYAFGSEPDGLLWLAMELVRGTPLSALLNTQGTLPLPRLVGLLERLCDVVHTAHEQGIIHRDIKPANVMVISRAGKLLPKLLDLGIAKVGVGKALLESASIMDGPLNAEEATMDFFGETTSRELTRRGAIVGSPVAMAPEQWVDPASADARTDVYALGILAYQALTGAPPFRSESVRGMATAHARQGVPRLAPSFPAGLNDVFARALAKKPADRYPTAMEFASALRAAAELEPAAAVPRLDRSLQELLFAQAPQSIAECAASLDAARSLREARDAAQRLALAAATHLGAAALGARMRAGPGDRTDAPDALAALRSMRRSLLSPEQWLQLAEELVRPFANRSEVHPLPELVALFQGTAVEALAGLTLAFDSETEDLTPLLRRLEASLRAMAPFFAYRLAVPNETRAELWIGLRTQRRPSTPWADRDPDTQSKPVLLDEEGSPAVFLWPFVQVRSPAPGAMDELFYLEGQGRFGAKLLSLPQAFERHDAALWDWVERRVDGLESSGDSSGTARAVEEAPYLGLSSFELRDATRYFGREREAEAFANRLRQQKLLAVVGPSGVGKSSFIQAGVVRLLPPGARSITLRPGPSPLLAVATKLTQDPAGPQLPPGLIASDLRTNPRRLAEILQQMAHKSRTPFLLLVVDQFEELVTLCSDEDERRALTLALQAVAEAPEDDRHAIRIVLTLRDDFLMRVQQFPALRERLTPGLQLLATPLPEDLRRIVIEPARLAGYEFDDASLPDEMVHAVSKEPGALALLSFTASKLWDLRDRQLRRLTRKAYVALGGVGGALAQHAEETLGRMSEKGQRSVREAFRHLVTSQGTRAIITRGEMEHLLAPNASDPQRAEARAVLEQLIAARLLVASEGAQAGEDRLEVIHEALLVSWPRLVKWQREDAESARLRDQLRAAARQWEERGRPRGLLWRREPLMEYRIWRGRYAGALTPLEEAFAGASLREETRGKRLRQGALLTAFLALSAGSVILYRARSTAEANALHARDQVALLLEEQGRQRLVAEDPLRGLAFLTESAKQGGRSTSLGYLMARGRERLEAEQGVLPHPTTLYAVALSPDGRTAASGSADGSVRLWGGQRGTPARALNGHRGIVYAVRFSPDGRRVASGGEDGTARVWDVATGDLVAQLTAGEAAVQDVRFHPDGDRLLAGSADGRVHLFRISAQQLLESTSLLSTPRDPAQSAPALGTNVAFAPDGSRWAAAVGGALVIGTPSPGKALRLPHAAGRSGLSFRPDSAELAVLESSGVRVWNAATGRAVSSLDTGAEALAVAYGPDGTRLFVAAARPEALVWEVPSYRPLPPLKAHTADLQSLAVARDHVATVGADGTARIWSVSDGLLLRTLNGHVDTVRRAALDQAGERLATLSMDGTLRSWDIRRPEYLARHRVGAAVHTATYSSAGAGFVTASADGVVRLLDTPSGHILKELRAPDGKPVLAAWASQDGQWIAAVGEAAIWILPTRGEGRPLALPTAGGRSYCVAWRPDGRELVTAHEDGTVRTWSFPGAEPRRVLSGHEGIADTAFYSPDGKQIVSAGMDATVRLWDATTGQAGQVLRGHATLVTMAVFSPDGRSIVSAGSDRRAIVWDAVTGTARVSLEGHQDVVVSAAFSPDGQRLVTSSLDGTVRVWDAGRGSLLSLTRIRGSGAWAEFSPDGATILAAEDDAVRLWRTAPLAVDVAETDAYARCRVPFEVEGAGALRPRTEQRCPPP